MKKFLQLLTILSLAGSAMAQDPLPPSPLTVDEEDSASDSDQDSQSSDTDTNVDADSSDENEGVIIKTEIPKQITLASPSSELKILSPWAPKPLQAPPVGWRYVPASPLQSYKSSVSLKSGGKVSLKIIPYILVPEDSPTVVQITEPGYEHSKGYRQTSSVTATLKSSNQLLSEASTSLVDSINDLEELLHTLPKPDTKKEPTP